MIIHVSEAGCKRSHFPFPAPPFPAPISCVIEWTAILEDLMKSITFAVPAFATAFLAVQAYPQSPADMKAMSSSADIDAMIAKAKRERKPDQPTFTQPILKFTPYTASLEYRSPSGRPRFTRPRRRCFMVLKVRER